MTCRRIASLHVCSKWYMYHLEYMNGKAGGDPKRKLLEAAVEYLARNGIADLSLRGLAPPLGTSHRMLLYHFGSREGLLVGVVRAVEARERKVLAELQHEFEPGVSPAEVARRFWHRLTD